MKKIIIISILLCISIHSFSQKNKEANLIQLDSTWGKEFFKFPIRFAQNINYEGIEEARFPPKGWRDVKHLNFWSYAFAWDINLNRKITENKLASDLEKYFDGLNGVNIDKNMAEFKASATIIKVKTVENTTFFIGKIQTFDRFATNKPITLNITIESRFCKANKKTVILFKFSPKEFKHKVWEITLKAANLYANICDE